MLVPELRELAEKIGLKSYKRLSKQDLIYKILDQQAADPKAVKAVNPVASTETKSESKAIPAARKPRQRLQKPVKTEEKQNNDKASDANPEAESIPKSDTSQSKEEKKPNNVCSRYD